MDRGNLHSRYSMTGRLVMDTALHIGGGHETSMITDSPVVRNTAGEPIIPGSSLKGAFRAAVERLLPSLGLQEFAQGMVPIGGIRSRGLGRCHLQEVRVFWVDFTDERMRRDYLVAGQMREEDGSTFIARYLGALVSG